MPTRGIAIDEDLSVAAQCFLYAATISVSIACCRFISCVLSLFIVECGCKDTNIFLFMQFVKSFNVIYYSLNSLFKKNGDAPYGTTPFLYYSKDYSSSCC